MEHGSYRGQSIPRARGLFILEIDNYMPVLKHKCYNLSSFNWLMVEQYNELPAQPN